MGLFVIAIVLFLCNIKFWMQLIIGKGESANRESIPYSQAVDKFWSNTYEQCNPIDRLRGVVNLYKTVDFFDLRKSRVLSQGVIQTIVPFYTRMNTSDQEAPDEKDSKEARTQFNIAMMGLMGNLNKDKKMDFKEALMKLVQGGKKEVVQTPAKDVTGIEPENPKIQNFTIVREDYAKVPEPLFSPTGSFTPNNHKIIPTAVIDQVVKQENWRKVRYIDKLRTSFETKEARDFVNSNKIN